MQQLMVVSRYTGEHVVCRADELAIAPRALFPRSSAVLENALGELQRAYLSTNGAISLSGIQWFLGVSIVELEDVPDTITSVDGGGMARCADCGASLAYSWRVTLSTGAHLALCSTCLRARQKVEAVAS
jgi:hypothetical protein